MAEIFDELRDTMTAEIRSHPFLKSCREGTVSRKAMHIFLEQQALYSRHFTRFLCALMSNLKENEQVLALAENLFEELGLDEVGAIPHSILYADMLKKFGIAVPDDAAALPETRALVAQMYQRCRDGDFTSGLGALCLGAEALVPAVYGDVLMGLKALGYSDEDCTFFQIHIECDDGHAETMEEILSNVINADQTKIDVVTTASRQVVDARYKFFDGIQHHAAKQLTLVS